MRRIATVSSTNPHPPSRERLRALVDAFDGQPVLMLADLVADRFVHGVPKRISREAPVLILRWEGDSVAPGGGANAAANVRSLGGLPLPVGCVGGDTAGRALLEAFEAAGIPTAGVLVRSGWRTPTKTRILAGFPSGIKQQVVRFDREEIRPLSAAERAELGARLAALGGRARVAILSDYGYGAVLPELIGDVRAALAPDSTVLVDSRFRLGDFRGADGATPNEEEAEALHGGPLDAGDGVDAAGRTLRERLAARFVLVTRGSLGMALFEAGRSAHIPVHGTDQVADVTGAGDTVIGTFALALAAGATPLEAALLANYAGGVVVMKTGTATLTCDELRDAIAADERPLTELRWARS
jgi:rfaE bifunctional protein kinase chain/domain